MKMIENALPRLVEKYGVVSPLFQCVPYSDAMPKCLEPVDKPTSLTGGFRDNGKL